MIHIPYCLGLLSSPPAFIQQVALSAHHASFKYLATSSCIHERLMQGPAAVQRMYAQGKEACCWPPTGASCPTAIDSSQPVVGIKHTCLDHLLRLLCEVFVISQAIRLLNHIMLRLNEDVQSSLWVVSLCSASFLHSFITAAVLQDCRLWILRRGR